MKTVNMGILMYLKTQFIEQIKLCKFTDDEGHSLENNVTFIQLMNQLDIENSKAVHIHN